MSYGSLARHSLSYGAFARHNLSYGALARRSLSCGALARQSPILRCAYPPSFLLRCACAPDYYGALARHNIFAVRVGARMRAEIYLAVRLRGDVVGGWSVGWSVGRRLIVGRRCRSVGRSSVDRWPSVIDRRSSIVGRCPAVGLTPNDPRQTDARPTTDPRPTIEDRGPRSADDRPTDDRRSADDRPTTTDERRPRQFTRRNLSRRCVVLHSVEVLPMDRDECHLRGSPEVANVQPGGRWSAVRQAAQAGPISCKKNRLGLVDVVAECFLGRCC